MQETKDPRSSESAGGDAGTESKDPKSDATSSETLKDVEAGEEEPATDDNGRGDTSSVPAPDGAFDDGGAGGDGIEDIGPM